MGSQHYGKGSASVAGVLPGGVALYLVAFRMENGSFCNCGHGTRRVNQCRRVLGARSFGNPGHSYRVPHHLGILVV